MRLTRAVCAAQLDSGASWIAEAKEANRRRQENAGKLEQLGVSGARPAPPAAETWLRSGSGVPAVRASALPSEPPRPHLLPCAGMQPMNLGKLALEEEEKDQQQKPVEGKARAP